MNIPKDIWRIKGKKGGPSVVVLGGVHGDEIVGIEVIKKLLDYFGLESSKSGKTYTNNDILGDLYLGFGNPEAIKKKTRGSGKGPDLNRSFQIEDLERREKKDDSLDLKRARKLFPLLKETDYLFDLHSTPASSEPFICMGEYYSENDSLYSEIPVKYILTDPDNILSRDFNKKELGTTDYIVNTFGGGKWSFKKYGKKRGVGFAYESGFKEDFKNIEIVFETILRLLNQIGLIKSKKNSFLKIKQTIYKLSMLIKVKENEGFHFNKKFKKTWSFVKRGEIIGEYDKSGNKEISPIEGRILFQKENTANLKKGETLFYIATLI